MKLYIGENCFIWFGSTPAILISDQEMIKEILSKNYVFQKPSNPLTKLLAQGVAVYDADKWAKHRRLLNPAFHLEKLKVNQILNNSCSSFHSMIDADKEFPCCSLCFHRFT